MICFPGIALAFVRRSYFLAVLVHFKLSRLKTIEEDFKARGGVTLKGLPL
jgi:hypothetical protein